jgi:hypothetical protein
MNQTKMVCRFSCTERQVSHRYAVALDTEHDYMLVTGFEFAPVGQCSMGEA